MCFFIQRSDVRKQVTLIWKSSFQIDGWVMMCNTGAEKASPQLMVGLHARKTDGHQTHSVKVFSLDWIFIDRCIISYMWFLVFSTLLLTYSQCRVYRILKILCYTGSVFCRPLVVVVVSGCECACMLCLG